MITPRTSSTSDAHRSASRRRAGVLFAAAAMLLAAGACKNTATNPGDLLGIAGTYQLVAVNALPLPYQDGNTFVVRGSLVIHGTPRYDLTETDNIAGSTTNFTSSGQWSASNNALVLKDDNGTDYFGALTGGRDTVRVQIGSHLGTYLRQ